MPPLIWAEFSIQYLIPAIFLVIWALNQVFGKAEAPPPPIRERVGPRPMPQPGPSRAPQPPSRAPRSNTPAAPRANPTAAPAPSRSRDAARSGGRGGAPARERPTAPPPGRVGEAQRTPRPVPADIQEVYAIYDDDRMEPSVQRAPAAAAASLSGQASQSSSAGPGAVLPTGLSAWANLAQTGIEPGRLREAIILSEILSPPAGLRRLQAVRARRAGAGSAEGS